MVRGPKHQMPYTFNDDLALELRKGPKATVVLVAGVDLGGT